MEEELIVLRGRDGFVARFGGLSNFCSSLVEAQIFATRTQAAKIRKILLEDKNWGNLWVEVHRAKLADTIYFDD